MLRVTEWALLATPFLAFVIWRLSWRYRISGRLFALSVLALGCACAAMIWFGLSRALPSGEPYVPAYRAPSGTVISP